jgi:subtilisin family serine protease
VNRGAVFSNLIKQAAAIGHIPASWLRPIGAIIDTGVDYKHLRWAADSARIQTKGVDLSITMPIRWTPMATAPASPGSSPPVFYAGNRYRGIAPNAKIIALRAMDNNASDQAEDIRIEQALQWVIAHRTQYNIVAVNISDGTGEFSGPTHQGPYWDEMQTLANQGVFIAAAAGNNGVQSPFAIEYPAADPNAYAVGSINSSDVISTFTERSADLDLLAPGENIPTTYYDPSTKKHIYVAATGTSFATPFAAGAAALLKQVDSSLRPSQIMDISPPPARPITTVIRRRAR